MLTIQISSAEKQLLILMVEEGLTQKQIAYRLQKTERTVRKQLEDMRARVGVRSTYQVIAIAIEHGLIGVPVVQMQPDR